MFKGKTGSIAEGSAPRSLLFDTSFRYNPEKDDLEGIVTPVATPDTSSVSTPVRNASPHTPSQSEDEDAENRLKSIQETPAPSPATYSVKDIYSRIRRQNSMAKESSSKPAKESTAKDESTAKEKPRKELLLDRSSDSRSPSPSAERPPEGLPMGPEHSKDGSWFGGIKGKIAKKFEEKRSRSQSMPSAITVDDQDDEEVEKAEEANPERMALLQEMSDLNQLEGMTEDDSWEKLEKVNETFSLEQSMSMFYKDFETVKQRWLELDSTYLASAVPNIIEDFRKLSLNVACSLVIAIMALMMIPVPAFLTGFIVATLFWWIGSHLSSFLWPTEKTAQVVSDLPQTNLNSTLLMPKPQENNLLEGWMNALPCGESYDVRTHLGGNCTTVHVRLQGSTLRIRTAKDKLPRRAMWDEKHRDINSVAWLGKQWFVELENADIRLVPDGLSPTRYWNKKYPIAISVPPKNGDEAKEVFLFGRTCRDKEYWFSLLMKTAKTPNGCHPDGSGSVNIGRRPCVDFPVYMNNLGLPRKSETDLKTNEDKKTQPALNQPSCPPMTLDFRDADTQWVNVFLGRVLYDFFTQPRWSEMVRAKLQKKLSKIKVPFFMDELTITDIDLGERLPLIRRTSNAVHCPHTGTWLDVEMAYNGCFRLTVHTKLNLMKLKKAEKQPQPKEQEMQEMEEVAAPLLFKDGYETPSDDDDDDSESAVQSNKELEEAQGATSKKILDMVDRISQWTLFQQATENAYIKKKIEELSNTDIKLTIQLSSLVGRLALNIPPPPSDRIWYGFRSVPRLEIKAIPQMGERELAFRVRLAGIIERALFQEFQRVLVMPNMDDLDLDIMDGVV